MKNAFVALVSLWIGVAAGYIAPSGTPEATKSGVTLAETIVPRLDAKVNSINSILDTSPVTEKEAILRNTIDDANDKALYEHGQEKQNNVNERSFLFLNQKYKKPARPQHHLSGARCDIFDQSLKEEGAEQLGGTPFKFSNKYFDGYKQYPNPTKLEKIDSYFAPPNHCNLDEKGDKNAPKNGITNAQRDYLELLKEPLLRTMKNQNQNQLQYKDKHYLASKAHPINMGGTKQYYIMPKTIQDNRLGAMVKNYGFTRPYLIHRPVFNKELEAMDANFLNDEDVQRVLNSGAEDKLLDRFLKSNYKEQQHKERLKGQQPDCSYHDCVLKTTKRVPHSSMGHEADCKCGNWLHLKSTQIKDRQQRGQYKQYETTIEPISAEQKDYEEILKSEPYMGKPDKELIKSMRKFKNVLHE